MSTRLLIVPLVLAAGCSALQLRPDPEPSADSDAMDRSAEAASVPVQRTGRYTAVALAVTEAERDPLAQIVTLRFPPSVRTVRTAIEHALRGTGYRFADFDASAPDLPLPDVHRELGPMRLTDAIAALAGEPWQLRVNPVTRVASLDLRPEFRRYLPAPAAVPAAVAAVVPTPTPTPTLVAVSATAVAPPPAPAPTTVAAAAAAPTVAQAPATAAAKPWRPAETVAAADSGEVVEDGLPAHERRPNPWLAAARPTLASASAPDAAAVVPAVLDTDDLRPIEVQPAAGRQQRVEARRIATATTERPDADADWKPEPPARLPMLVRLGPGTLSVLLDGWMRNAGWALVWRSGTDFRVDVPFSVDAGSPADPARLMAGLSDLYGIPHCAYPVNHTIVVLQPGTDLRQECR